MIIKTKSGHMYEVVDHTKLHDFVFDANEKMMDGKSVSKRFEEAGITDSTLVNTKSNWINAVNKNWVKPEEWEPVKQPGLIRPGTLKVICGLYNLDYESFLIRKKEKNEVVEEVKEEVVAAPSLDELNTRIDELAAIINKLGNIQMQQLEYMRAIIDSLADASCMLEIMSDELKNMNNKYNKPSAYIRR